MRGDGDPPELPKGWEWKKMGDVATVVGGSTPKSKEPSYWGGGIPWLGVADLTGYDEMYIAKGARSITKAGYESCSAQKVPAGTVLFSSRAPIGYVGIATRELCTSQGFKSFVPGSDVTSEYLYWWLKHAKPIAESMASGTTFKELSGRRAAEIPVAVPPLTEQRRIISTIEQCLASVDAAAEPLRAAAARLTVLRATLLQQAVAVGDERTVGDLLERIEAGRSFRCHGHPASIDKWGVIKVSAMTWGDFREGENKEVLDEAHVDERWEIQAGDLLISRANTADYVGAAVLVQEARPKLLLSDKSLRLVPKAAEASPAWLCCALNARASREQMSALATGTSDSMRNLSQDKIRAVRLRVPPLDEQERLARRISSELSMERRLGKMIADQQEASGSLRRAVLRDAMWGRLGRVDARNAA